MYSINRGADLFGFLKTFKPGIPIKKGKRLKSAKLPQYSITE